MACVGSSNIACKRNGKRPCVSRLEKFPIRVSRVKASEAGDQENGAGGDDVKRRVERYITLVT